jgi:hypothetical protein
MPIDGGLHDELNAPSRRPRAENRGSVRCNKMHGVPSSPIRRLGRRFEALSGILMGRSA